MLLFLLVSIVAALLFHRLFLRDPYKGLSLPPGPKGIPVFGNLLQIGYPPWRGFTQLAKTYGDVFFVHIGSIPAVVLNSARAMKLFHEEFSEEMAHRPMHATIFDVISNHNVRSIVAADGETWRKGRRLLMQLLLAKEKLPGYDSLIVDEIEHVELADLATPSGTVDDIFLIMTKAVMCITLRLCFGRDVASRSDPRFVKLASALDRLSTLLNKGNPADFFPALQWLPQPFRYEFKKHVDEVYEVAGAFLQDVRAAEGDDAATQSLAHTLLKHAQQENMSEEFITGLLVEVMCAGIETTSNLIGWILVLLANNPDVQQTLRQQVRDALGDRHFNVGDAKHLPYLNAVIWETMRYVALVPMPPPRMTTENLQIEGMDIPAHTLIFTNLHACFYDSSVYADPDRFRPERFMAGSFADPQDCTHVEFAPFNVGPRACPGARLAMFEVQIAITELLRRFHIMRPGEAYIPVDPNNNLVAKPQDPVCLVFERPHGSAARTRTGVSRPPQHEKVVM